MSMDAFIQKTAREANAAVLKRFGKDGVYYSKSDRAWDVVTKADLLSERIILSAIRKAYPDHGIISEESGVQNENARYVWIVDPIDGTMHFANGTPLFGIFIALAHEGRVVLSTVSLPATGELFFAKAGKGAYRNGKRIHCSKRKEWAGSIGCVPSILNDRSIVFLRRFLAQAPGKRFIIANLGSANDPYVALGRRDWCISIGAKIWDYAACSLILKEAGCVVTNLKGEPWQLHDGELMAANPILHKQLLKLTKNI